MKCGKFLTTLVMGISGTAVAAGQAEAPKINFLYHFSLNSNNDGLKAENVEDKSKPGDGKEYATTSMMQNAFSGVFSGKASDKVSYKARYNFLDSKLDYAYAEYEVMKALSVAAGRAKVKTYGFDQWDGNPLSTYGAVGADTTPVKYTSLIGATFRMMGEISLQLFEDDYVRADGKQYKKTDASGEALNKNPGYAFEYKGKFGPIQPLVQYLVYDMGHSSSYTIGAKFETKQILAGVEQTGHTMNYKGALEAGSTTKFKEMSDVASRTNLFAEFNAGMVTPYVSYSMFDLEQDVVSPAPQPDVNSAIGTWDDNAKNWAVGAFYNRIGDAFRPYLNISSTSGKFTSPKNGKSTELSEMVTTVGITGSW